MASTTSSSTMVKPECRVRENAMAGVLTDMELMGCAAPCDLALDKR